MNRKIWFSFVNLAYQARYMSCPLLTFEKRRCQKSRCKSEPFEKGDTQTKLEVPQNAAVHWNGFPAGQFQETFTLPAPINAERAEANYTNGVLTLNLPKAEHVKARTVKVTAKR